MEFSSGSNIPLNEVIDAFRNKTHRDKIMVLNLFVDPTSYEDNMIVKNTYLNAVYNHNLSLLHDPHFFNAGFDLFLTEDQNFTSGSVNKTSFKVKCSAYVINMHSNDLNQYYTGYHMHPRSSLSKTELRLANSTGIIDAGYRGPLIGMFDCLKDGYRVAKFTRLLQICAPELMPIYVRVVDTIDELGPETSRGEGGFGSTGL